MFRALLFFFLLGNCSPDLHFQQHEPVSCKYIKTQLTKSQVLNLPYLSQKLIWSIACCVTCLRGKKGINMGRKKKGNSIFPEASCTWMDPTTIIMKNETWTYRKGTQPILHYFWMPKKAKKKKTKHQTVVEYSIKRQNLFVCFLLISLCTEAAIKCHHLAVPTEKIPVVVKVKRSLNT